MYSQYSKSLDPKFVFDETVIGEEMKCQLCKEFYEFQDGITYLGYNNRRTRFGYMNFCSTKCLLFVLDGIGEC